MSSKSTEEKQAERSGILVLGGESGLHQVGKREPCFGASEWTRTTDPHHVKVVL